MDAAIVDDHERPLSGEGFAAIGKELAALYEALASHDLAAGSPDRVILVEFKNEKLKPLTGTTLAEAAKLSSKTCTPPSSLI